MYSPGISYFYYILTVHETFRFTLVRFMNTAYFWIILIIRFVVNYAIINTQLSEHALTNKGAFKIHVTTYPIA